MISEIKRLLNEQHEAVARCDRSQQYAVAASYDREIEKRQQAAQKAFARRNGWIVTQSLTQQGRSPGSAGEAAKV